MSNETLLQLKQLREKIDQIDKEILSLLISRGQLACKIGEVKKAAGMEVLDPSREREIIESLSAMDNEVFGRGEIRRIFAEIISACRSLQSEHKIAFLGPEASFCHQAAGNMFGWGTNLVPAASIGDVFKKVETGQCQAGIVPLENSFEGSVNITLDKLYEFNLKICAEMVLRIRQNLLSKDGDMKKIRRVCSHPMALSQCYAWLNKNLPEVQLREAPSTSEAAKLVLDGACCAVIGSSMLADSYGLEFAAKGIEDSPDNMTRFIAIAKKDGKPTGNDKTSILFSLPHQPGSLSRALECFSSKGINMTRIESRPMKVRNWEYLFFVDIKGHEKDENVSAALEDLARRSVFMKCLGSYPAGGEPWD